MFTKKRLEYFIKTQLICFHRSLKQAITNLLTNKYFVPLYRVHDNAFQAKVHRPVISSSLLKHDESRGVQLTPSKQLTPIKLRGSPVVAAVVGPFTDRRQADECYEKWASPNRKLKPGFLSMLISLIRFTL